VTSGNVVCHYDSADNSIIIHEFKISFRRKLATYDVQSIHSGKIAVLKGLKLRFCSEACTLCSGCAGKCNASLLNT